MAVYTHFRFTQLGERAITKVNGIVAALGVWYNQGLPITTEKANPIHIGEPYDLLKYDITDGTLTSNEANITVNFPPNKLNAPTSSDFTTSMDNEDSINIASFLTYNDAVDRIKIISYTTAVGELLFYGTAVYPNQVIMQYDLANLIFNSLTGNGNPYQKIYFKVGNADGYSAATYSGTINVNGLASLINLFELTEEVSEEGIGYKQLESTLKIENGYVNSIANVQVEINLDPLAWPVGTENIAQVSYNGNNIDLNSNGITALPIPLDETGESEIIFNLAINLTDLPIVGTIIFTLLDIDGNSALISTINEQTYNINF